VTFGEIENGRPASCENSTFVTVNVDGCIDTHLGSHFSLALIFYAENENENENGILRRSAIDTCSCVTFCLDHSPLLENESETLIATSCGNVCVSAT
jgi:hypothetical protein